MVEKWKDIQGFEGLYQVSNLGNIRSLKYYRTNIVRNIKGNLSNNYLMVSLCKNKIKKNLLIHRIVGITFIKNPDNKCDINHKNGIKTDNRLENLEWNTRSENVKHAYKNNLAKSTEYSRKIAKEFNSKKVIDIVSGKVFNSIMEASDFLNIKYSCLCLKLNNKKQNDTNLKFLKDHV